jgi:hypothetical protein
MAGFGVTTEVLCTKYIDWGYEDEARIFTALKDKDSESNLYFADFGEDCALREVIVGPLCSATQADLKQALGKPRDSVQMTKARLAFKSFKIVTNKLGLR